MSEFKLHVKSGDTVMVISGANKGKSGKIQRAFPKTGKIIVEGVAMVKRHQKPRGQGMPGGIVEKEAAIPASNVLLVCPSCKKPTRIGNKRVEATISGKTKMKGVRICKECGAVIE